MGCGRSIVKYSLVVINTLFFLAGAAVLGIGLWVRFDPNIEQIAGTKTGLEEFRQTLYLSAYILIGFGAFTFLVGFCGCCGALRESKCLLGIYITLVAIVLAAEIAGGVYAYVRRDDIIKIVKDEARKYIRTTYYNGSESDRAGLNFVMVYFECCGVDGRSDFSQFSEGNSTYYFPEACCTQKDPDDGKVKLKNEAQCEESRKKNMTDGINNVGCGNKLEEFFKDKAGLMLGIGAGISGFQLLVIGAASFFCRSIDKDD